MAYFDQSVQQGYQQLSRPSWSGGGQPSMATPYLNDQSSGVAGMTNPTPSSANSPMQRQMGGTSRMGGGSGWNWGNWGWGQPGGNSVMSPPGLWGGMPGSGKPPQQPPRNGPTSTIGMPPIGPPTGGGRTPPWGVVQPTGDIPPPPPYDTGTYYPPGQSPFDKWNAQWGEAWRRRQGPFQGKPAGGGQTPPWGVVTSPGGQTPPWGGVSPPLPNVYTHPSHPAENGNPYAVPAPPSTPPMGPGGQTPPWGVVTPQSMAGLY